MYVHCSKCDWEQDDFWSRLYNPLTQLISDFATWSRPRMIWTEDRVFSWLWLARCVYWRIVAPFRQRWWTYAAFKRDTDKRCPKCKSCALWTD